MQRLIIDCQTGKQVIEELTPDEESQRLKEIANNIALEKAEREKEVKRRLARELAELREMKAQKGIFSDEDISEKQKQVDTLAAML